jgi:acyl dehydratase
MVRELDIQALQGLLGQEIACSGWRQVSQERIDAFAAATDDHQWIHVDVARAHAESPFRHPADDARGVTVAHGFLTLSLIPALFSAAVLPKGARMLLNYGLNKVRFPAPLAEGSAVRARFVLAGLEAVEGGWQLNLQVTMEARLADGSVAAKPVCVAEFLVRWFT